MSSPATPSIECEHCTHKATLACAGCKVAPTTAVDTFKTTWHCGVSCQKADWNNHKETCKASQARKSSFRAGEIAQYTFYTYRVKLFDKFVLSVERMGTTSRPRSSTLSTKTSFLFHSQTKSAVTRRTSKLCCHALLAPTRLHICMV